MLRRRMSRRVIRWPVRRRMILLRTRLVRRAFRGPWLIRRTLRRARLIRWRTIHVRTFRWPVVIVFRRPVRVWRRPRLIRRWPIRTLRRMRLTCRHAVHLRSRLIRWRPIIVCRRAIHVWPLCWTIRIRRRSLCRTIHVRALRRTVVVGRWSIHIGSRSFAGTIIVRRRPIRIGHWPIVVVHCRPVVVRGPVIIIVRASAEIRRTCRRSDRRTAMVL